MKRFGLLFIFLIMIMLVSRAWATPSLCLTADETVVTALYSAVPANTDRLIGNTPMAGIPRFSDNPLTVEQSPRNNLAVVWLATIPDFNISVHGYNSNLVIK
ncbi:MAG: hypothetical protein GY804_08710 [Alphaproteobacteria bacterium]|nr:hypothetical protein [Alphaproteobacteria bacterium]